MQVITEETSFLVYFSFDENSRAVVSKKPTGHTGEPMAVRVSLFVEKLGLVDVSTQSGRLGQTMALDDAGVLKQRTGRCRTTAWGRAGAASPAAFVWMAVWSGEERREGLRVVHAPCDGCGFDSATSIAQPVAPRPKSERQSVSAVGQVQAARGRGASCYT